MSKVLLKYIDATDITLPRPYPKELPDFNLTFWSLHVTTTSSFSFFSSFF